MITRHTKDIIYILYGLTLRPAARIAWFLLDITWVTIKGMFLVGFELAKATTLIASLVLFSFFKMFVLGIVMKG